MQIMQEAETWPDWKKTYYNDNIATSAHSKKLKLEETSMNDEEIVKALKELLPEQVDYAELVGSPVPSSYGHCYVWEDPEPYIIQKGIDLITRQQDKIANLTTLNKEAMELLEFILSQVPQNCEYCDSLPKQKDCPSPFADCETDCVHINCPCRGCSNESGLFPKWRWVHADRYEALKAQSNAPTKKTDGEG